MSRPSDQAERVGRALVVLTRRPEVRERDPAEALVGVPPDRLVAMANHHRVPGIVYRALAASGWGRDDGPEAEAAAALRASTQMASVSHVRCLAELGSLVGTVAGGSGAWLVVKGPVLVERCYRDPTARLYGDLDVVVEPSGFGDALARIEAAGGTVPALNWPMVQRRGRAEIPVTLPLGLSCDLHWHLLVDRGDRARFSMDLGEMAERRRTVDVAGVPVPTLEATDTVHYLAVHAGLSGGHHLVWLKDLDATMVADPPDWDALVDRSRRAGTALMVAMQLARASTVLGAPVPGAVVERLADGAPWWRWWCRRERSAGPARWGALGGTDRTLVAATSRTSAASAVQLARSLVVDVARPAVAARRRGGAEGPPALYTEAGGESGRRSYLAAVAATSWT